MRPEEGRPEIYDEFKQLLPGINLDELDRWKFYDAGATAVLAISTGEKRTFANIMITVGCA